MIKVVALDWFGTVVNPIDVPKVEIQDYVRRTKHPVYHRMYLPTSWEKIPAFPDSKEGIELLRTRFKVVTCSNWNYGAIRNCLVYNGIEVDKIIEPEEVQAYKPSLVTYALICDKMQVNPDEVLFVTGNKGGPDNTGAPEKIGMKTILIRHGWPNNLIELAGEMGC